MSPRSSYLSAGLTQRLQGRTIPPYTNPAGSSGHAGGRTSLGSRAGSPELSGHQDEARRSLIRKKKTTKITLLHPHTPSWEWLWGDYLDLKAELTQELSACPRRYKRMLV